MGPHLEVKERANGARAVSRSLFAGPFVELDSLVCWPPPHAMTFWSGWSRESAKSPD